jgi:hypothetical protein
MTSLTYYLLLKGLKGASFISEETLAFIDNNQALLLIGSFVFWVIVMQLAISVFKKNVLKFVVLSGTFALAMAFAGNDLVNFIGVPLAGFDAYDAWKSSGLPADQMTMEMLNEPVKSNTLYLILAGIIMVFTLYFSKKARTVLETQVDLSRQEEGEERFKPHGVARLFVSVSLAIGKVLSIIIPRDIKRQLERALFRQMIEKTTERPLI